MLVMLLGISIEIRLLNRLKALLSMLVTLLGIIVVGQPNKSVLVAVSIIALQLFRLSYLGFPASTDIEVTPLHAKKA